MSAKVPKIVAEVSISSNTSSITSTPIFTPSAPGNFRVSGYIGITLSDQTTGFVTLSISYLDGVSDSVLTSALKIAQASSVETDGNSNIGEGSVFIHSTAAAISYKVDSQLTSAAPFSLYITVEEL